ncbi:MAG: hypothetical protein IT379_15965, partial [Deltaproteobacteria bacterium]|nr:hypothetical protein [Deltaproteobacteria bacterium]
MVDPVPGCGDDNGAMVIPSLPGPRVEQVLYANPVVPGTRFVVSGSELPDPSIDRVELIIDDGATRVSLPAPQEDLLGMAFVLDAAGHAALGEPGFVDATCTLRATRPGRGVREGSAPCPFDLEPTVTPSLLSDVDGAGHWNDPFVVNVAGLLMGEEGTTFVDVDGTYTREGGSPVPVFAQLGLVPVDRFDRSRATLIASTDLGGIHPGRFEGTMTIGGQTADGFRTMGETRRLAITFALPEVRGLDPPTVSLGQLVRIRGAGFLGGREDESTVFRLEGSFTPAGGAPITIPAVEVVPTFVSGQEMTIVIDAEPTEDRTLVNPLFRAARGAFSGNVTVITSRGVDQVSGVPVPGTITLGPVRQVVWVHFVGSFDASLERFGLGAAAEHVKAAAIARMQEIYRDYNVDLRTERPTDWGPNGYATLEIGGPDPTGRGLFGFDNTPGKDIGNVRLFDKIGGINAITQEDGSPGYGGVFIDSFLYWSTDPGLPGERPAGAPEPEPLFDEIFGPVRARPATLDEADGFGSDERNELVAFAIGVLGSLVGETASHELGHSFGLAEPYGSSTVFHSAFPDEGCLMDSGGDRPFGERANL